jgi:hypothetical protein
MLHAGIPRRQQAHRQRSQHRVQPASSPCAASRPGQRSLTAPQKAAPACPGGRRRQPTVAPVGVSASAGAAPPPPPPAAAGGACWKRSSSALASAGWIGWGGGGPG